MKKLLKIPKVYYIGIPVLVFGILTIFMAIEAASVGAKLTLLDQKASELVKENNDLSGRLVSSTSLLELSGRTEELGFTKPTNIVYITREDVVASLMNN